jgi:hypothetical protein
LSPYPLTDGEDVWPGKQLALKFDGFGVILGDEFLDARSAMAGCSSLRRWRSAVPDLLGKGANSYFRGTIRHRR